MHQTVQGVANQGKDDDDDQDIVEASYVDEQSILEILFQHFLGPC